MMYSTEAKAEAGVGLVVHDQEDAGHDLDHERQQRQAEPKKYQPVLKFFGA